MAAPDKDLNRTALEAMALSACRAGERSELTENMDSMSIDALEAFVEARLDVARAPAQPPKPHVSQDHLNPFKQPLLK